MTNREILNRLTSCAYGNKDHALEMQKVWQRILSQVDIELFIKDHRNSIRIEKYEEGDCPFDGCKKEFSIKKESKLFNCWMCKKRGDVITLCSKLLKKPLIDVAYYLVEKYDIDLEGLL